jgi:hypothetical protein
MIQTRNAESVLATGIDQAIRFNAPSEMIARLRGAHAFASLGKVEGPKQSAPVCVAMIPPPDAAAVQDE